MNIDWKKMLPHIAAVAIFLTVSIAYFYPALEGYMIKSHDINMHKGMSKEVFNHRDTYGEEPLWTNSMFGGMPATQISVIYKSNLIGKIDKALMSILPHPINYLFLYMIGFYILLLCMKVDPWLAMAGAIAYGFSSYFFIIMGAGHNSKAVAVGYMAPALGGFLLAYRKKVFLGVAIMTLFMSLQINANHPQVTYYFFILLFFIFLYKAISYFKKKELPSFAKITGLVAIGTVLAISTNIPNLYGTYEYSPHTQRGGSELTDNTRLDAFSEQIETLVLNKLKLTGCDTPKCILELPTNELIAKTGLDKETVDGVVKILSKKGMSKDYALQWSYGKGETWNFLIPNAKGGSSSLLLGNPEFAELEGNTELKEMLSLNYQLYTSRVSSEVVTDYFGNQASTAGPVYIGAIVCLFFVLAMVFWTNKLKWPLLVMMILSIGLAWGKNLQWLTDLFWDFAPAYSKFRAVTIILVMVELILPLVGILWIWDVIKNKEKYTGTIKLFGKKEVESKKLFFGVSGFVALITLLFAFMPSALIEMENEGDKAFFTPATFNTQIATMVKMDPKVVPPEYASNPDEYASLLIQSYSPKLKTAEKQLITYREGVIQKDALRSFLFVLLGAVLLYFFMYKKIQTSYFSVALAALLLIDFWGIDVRYLSNEKGPQGNFMAWQEKEEKLIPFMPTYADFAILTNEMTNSPEISMEVQKEAVAKLEKKGDALTYKEEANAKFGRLSQLTNYRVFLLSGGYSQETSISYYHKSLGGYHSAKIQRYQDLIERKLNQQMQLASNPNTLAQANIINMLNTKYIITNPNGQGKFIDMNNMETLSEVNQRSTPGFLNNEAYGNAWFVSEVKAYNSPDDEFAGIDEVDLKNVATTDETFERNQGVVGTYSKAADASIKMSSYRANEINYLVENATEGDHYAVFSEIFYQLGWKAYLDGKEAPINRVDYTLRGVKIPAGTKEVSLRYELDSYKSLSTVALITSVIIILLVLSLFYLSVFKGKDA